MNLPVVYRILTGGMLPLFLLITLFFVPITADAGKGERILRRVQEKFEGLETLSVHFESRYIALGSEDVQVDAGRLYIAKGGRFRTETNQQTIVSDGQSVWMYNSLENQVIIRDLESGADDIVTPQKLLYEYPDRYHIQDVVEDMHCGLPCDRLVLVPKEETDPARQLQVWIDRPENLTRKFLLEDLADNITVFEFEAFRLNENLPEETFRFTPPEGAEVIDMR